MRLSYKLAGTLQNINFMKHKGFLLKVTEKIEHLDAIYYYELRVIDTNAVYILIHIKVVVNTECTSAKVWNNRHECSERSICRTFL